MYEGAVADAVRQLLQVRRTVRVLVAAGHQFDRGAGVHRGGDLVARPGRGAGGQIATEDECDLTLHAALRNLGRRNARWRGVDRVGVDHAARRLALGWRHRLERADRLAQACGHCVLDRVRIADARRRCVGWQTGQQITGATSADKKRGSPVDLLYVHLSFSRLPERRLARSRLSGNNSIVWDNVTLEGGSQ